MGKKVFLVDDDEDFRFLIGAHLRRFGYQVVEFDDGSSIVKHLNTHRPELIILDMVMNGQEGVETLNQLKDLDDKPAIIAVSSNAWYLTSASVLGADATLVKPIPPDVLEKTIASIFG